MPFNDYWTEPPALTDATRLLIGGLVASRSSPLLLAGEGQLAARPARFRARASTLCTVSFWHRGQKPLPTAPGSDLPSVLKALYLQRHFARFAIDHQGVTDADLHAAFGTFLTAHAPSDRDGPTQAPA